MGVSRNESIERYLPFLGEMLKMTTREDGRKGY